MSSFYPKSEIVQYKKCQKSWKNEKGKKNRENRNDKRGRRGDCRNRKDLMIGKSSGS